MNPIIKINGRGLPLTIDDMDTDRIIPARYLRCVTFDGIGDNVFYDERFDSSGKLTSFPMNNELYKGASIILGGKNFGCGSSREHAPQAIKRAGFKAIIAESFAEIFIGNSTTIGLPCVVLSKNDISTICRHIAEDPKSEVSIDIELRKVYCNSKEYDAQIPDTIRQSFIKGTYDLLFELIKNKDKVSNIESALPY